MEDEWCEARFGQRRAISFEFDMYVVESGVSFAGKWPAVRVGDFRQDAFELM